MPKLTVKLALDLETTAFEQYEPESPELSATAWRKELSVGGAPCISLEIQPVDGKGKLTSGVVSISSACAEKGAEFTCEVLPKEARVRLHVSGSFAVTVRDFMADDLKKLGKSTPFAVRGVQYFRYDAKGEVRYKAVAAFAGQDPKKPKTLAQITAWKIS